MPAIDAIVAVVWAAFLTLMFVVMSYFGFVVAGRQDRALETSAEEQPTEAPEPAAPT